MDTQASADFNDVVRNTAQEFAAFFQISSEAQSESVAENIEGVLARLDELYGMLDMIRSDNNLATDELLPIVRDDLSRLQPVFEQIDRLDEFVQMIRRNITEVEKEVKLAEKDFGALSSIKKVVTSLPLFSFKKRETPHHTPLQPVYVLPRIFSTSQFIRRAQVTPNEEENESDVTETLNRSTKKNNSSLNYVMNAEES